MRTLQKIAVVVGIVAGLAGVGSFVLAWVDRTLPGAGQVRAETRVVQVVFTGGPFPLGLRDPSGLLHEVGEDRCVELPVELDGMFLKPIDLGSGLPSGDPDVRLDLRDDARLPQLEVGP